MKSQSLEYQLRHMVAPAPDPAARLRARRAALAEFERIHTAKIEAAEPKPAATPPGPSPSRPSRKAWLGAVATACVAVVAVSVVWLMPPEQRDVRRYAPSPTKVVTPATEHTTTSSASSTEPTTAAPSEKTAPISKPEPTVEQRRAGALAELAEVKKNTQESLALRPLDPKIAEPELPAVQNPQQQARGARSPTLADSESRHEEITVTGIRAPIPQQASSPISVMSGSDVLDKSVGNGALASASMPMPAPAPPALPQVQSPEGRDKFPHFTTNPVKRVADDPVSTFSVDVDTASYAFVRRQLNSGVLPQGDAVRVEEMINYFDYDWPVPDSREEPFKPTVTVSDSPWGEGKKLIHIGIKGYEVPVRQQLDVNLVLLLDVSGSMDEPDKLPLAQRSMALLLDTLKPTDTVAIVVYAGRAGQVLEPTPVRDKDTILSALNSLRPGGSTAGAAGIQLAYQLAEKSFRRNGVNRILLATDGDFNVGITDQNELKSYVEREREKGVYLSVLGFGQGNYRDEMAQTLAQNGNGVAAYIDTLNEARKVLVQESTASLFTIAKDVKLQIEFNPKTVAEYRLVGYETRALNREDFNNDKVDAGDVGSGHTVTAIYEITPVGSKSTLIDASRYAAQEQPVEDTRGKGNEYGFLKIRYKLPNGVRSKLITQPIRIDAGVPASLRDDVQFSTAVAGFAQILRGGQYTDGLSFEDVIRDAGGALGRDRHEYRAEFVQMVRKAQAAKGM